VVHALLNRPFLMEPSRRGVIWILLAAIIATLAKLYCAVTTLGTEDVALYFRFGQVTEARGLAFAMTNPSFNHTPLVAEYAATLFAVLDGKAKWFPLLIKLPGILASLGSVLALIWLQRRIPKIPTYAIVLFALSPAAFMIDGFHGNIDSVMTLLLLLAGCACAASNPSHCSSHRSLHFIGSIVERECTSSPQPGRESSWAGYRESSRTPQHLRRT
jgi:Gpi18-like mannosyltransferase